MLPLDDDRWSQLTTFFGRPEDLPRSLADWIAAIGFDQEDEIYRRDLCHQFLHQATITNAAFAVAPWLIDVCRDGTTSHQVEYLTDVALIEANRLRHGVYYYRSGTDPYPAWLMEGYKHAVGNCIDLVEEVLATHPEEGSESGLAALKPVFLGNAELAWSNWGAASSS